MIQQYKYEKLFYQNFSLPFKMEIKQSIDIALETYNQFLIENRALMSYPKKSLVSGYWRTYIIERQIYNRAFVPDAKYSVRLQETTKFHDQALFLETEHFTINIARTLRPTMLPSKSSYKLECSKNNENSNLQIRMDFEKNVLSDSCFPQYAIITYGFNKLTSKVSHIMYLVPDHTMDKILLSDNGMVVPEVIPSYTHEEKEETIIQLKKELKKKVEE